MDIDGRTLSFYENGTREKGANRLYQIATALHVNANDLDLEWMGCTNVQTRMDDEMVGMFTGMSVEQKAQILEFARFIMHGKSV